jgi:hypothetical protein
MRHQGYRDVGRAMKGSNLPLYVFDGMDTETARPYDRFTTALDCYRRANGWA